MDAFENYSKDIWKKVYSIALQVTVYEGFHYGGRKVPQGSLW